MASPMTERLEIKPGNSSWSHPGFLLEIELTLRSTQPNGTQAMSEQSVPVSQPEFRFHHQRQLVRIGPTPRSRSKRMSSRAFEYGPTTRFSSTPSVRGLYSGRSRCFFRVFSAVRADCWDGCSCGNACEQQKNMKSPVFEFRSQLLSWIFQQHRGKSEHIEAKARFP
jgi:hypothetical protein